MVSAGVALATLLLAVQLGSRLGKSTQAIVTHFMGLIVASMGMQFVLNGMKVFLHIWCAGQEFARSPLPPIFTNLKVNLTINSLRPGVAFDNLIKALRNSGHSPK